MLTSCPYLPYYSLYTPIYTYPPFLRYHPYYRGTPGDRRGECRV